ncbi:MAG: sensor histidine kinase [Acidobacteriota bacterium]
MAAEELIARFHRFGFALARVVLGLLCLTAQYYAPRRGFTGVTVMSIVFFSHGVLVLFLGKFQKTVALALLSLVFDTVYFLVFASYGNDPGLWLSSMFYMYLMLAAVLAHEWSDVLMVSGVCMAFFGLAPWPALEPLRRLVLLASVLACVLAYGRHKVQVRMAETQRQAERDRAEAQHARADERQRIAGDFHDGPLQDFIGLQVRLDILRRLLERDRAAAEEDLRQLQELAKRQVVELRSFLRTMRPPAVEGTDLVAHLRRLTEDFQKDTSIPTRFTSSDVGVTAPPEACQEILQVVREALQNAQKHSQAARVAVSLRKVGGNLEIAVDDNGAGFGFSGSFTLEELELLQMGPQSIQRRVRSLGGELTIDSRPGQGTGLRFRIPA